MPEDMSSGLRELIAQSRAAAHSGYTLLGLFGALALPDIAGALASDDGRATGSKYKAWLAEWVPEHADAADAIYGLRCSLLHQGRAQPHGDHLPVMFTHGGGPPQVHNLVLNVDDQRILAISIEAFVEEIGRGVETWLDKYGESSVVQRNLEKHARLRPAGLPPWVDGFPVVA